MFAWLFMHVAEQVYGRQLSAVLGFYYVFVGAHAQACAEACRVFRCGIKNNLLTLRTEVQCFELWTCGAFFF